MIILRQEYTRAYNAYSAALQLSPVGPSSHVFLSNRAAALLSLKRYSAAATDARRAVALAPTFGKAHARLGQALYFLKDYAGAVAAYEDAIRHEPDNQVTQTYLEKAKAKLAKQQDKAQRYARGEDVSIADSSVQHTVINSIASDPNASAAIVSGEFQRGKASKAISNAIAGRNQKNRYGLGKPLSLDISGDEEDPDFDEALNIQKGANRFLANKQYKEAIEEYTAALFLVPDDPNLSPQLHLGRAHALNGSRRHASARNDAQLAIKIKPSAEAYSTLAKSLFYLKEFEAAVVAFDNTIKMLPEGESLSPFDLAYLQKASAAVAESGQNGSARKSPSKSSPVPKLPPPRFVPREQAINSTPNLPPMPKQWPQQSPRSPTALRCGPEREIVFFSESLGIKLNRGPDGIVRVLSVSKDTPASPVARKGDIHAGDVIREAAGVDIRRPITNIMWGDTVALIRLSPRPITLLVAKELSEVPHVVKEQRRLAEAEERATASQIMAQTEEVKYDEDGFAAGDSP
jgi:tetratricopeptide (TPR) repeat protein